MKRILSFTLVLLFLLLSISGCREFFGLLKPSLILKYYQGPYQWGDITLGQSTIEETKDALCALDEVLEKTIHKANIYDFVDIAIFADFQEGYRESSLGIWFIDGKAQIIEFFGDELTLDEIQTHLGNVEKFAVFTLYRGTNLVIDYDGFSLKFGYIIEGGRDIKRFEKDIQGEEINEKTIFFLYLIHPDVIDEFYYEGSDYWNYFFEEGGFQDWHGYGEYEVQRPDFLN